MWELGSVPASYPLKGTLQECRGGELLGEALELREDGPEDQGACGRWE